MKKFIIIGVIIIFVIFGIRVVTQQNTSPKQSPGASQVIFGTPKKSAHWEGNTPAHGTTFAAVPINVVIDVNFDLAAPSSISITSSGKEYGIRLITIDANKLAMRRKLDSSAPDGSYTVTYKACWPDGSCHDGNFQFAIDSRLVSGYSDKQGSPDVTVELSNLEFIPKKIRISKNTRVTWKNNDTVDHYINTDNHPSHTYYPVQNSKVIKTGDGYAIFFSEPGEYPYHCSAHALTMTGSIIVE